MFQNLRLEIWKNIHSLPLGFIRFWQLRALQSLARHAYLHTGLYHDLWDKNGIGPSQLKHLSDLQRFPVINKKTFLNAPVESYIGLIKQQFYIWRYTSGTGGQPFPFTSINGIHSPYANFLRYRFLYWERIQPSIIQKKMPMVRISSAEIKRITYQANIDIPLTEFLTNPKKIIKELVHLQPIVIESYPSVLVEIAQAAIEFSQFQKLGIQYAISYGENLKSWQRKFIEDTLECEVIDRYGIAETGVIATECRYHDSFHLNTESFILEIVDTNGASLPSGKTGRIIITDLRNYVMPFIRYDIGDQGRFLPGHCPCGLEGERFVVNGREGVFLALGSAKVHHLEFDKVMDSFSGAIIQYQVAKIDEHAVTLFIICGPAMTEFILNHIREKMQALIGTDCRLNIEFVTKIKRAPRGKCQTLIST